MKEDEMLFEACHTASWMAVPVTGVVAWVVFFRIPFTENRWEKIQPILLGGGAFSLAMIAVMSVASSARHPHLKYEHWQEMLFAAAALLVGIAVKKSEDHREPPYTF
jgi:hypothetical protein